jgi:hypothetical protein
MSMARPSANYIGPSSTYSLISMVWNSVAVPDLESEPFQNL